MRMECPAGHRSMRVELPARPESVTRARHAAAGFAARAGADIADVSLAVSEAVGNAVIHAFEEGEQGMIVVSGEIEAGGVLVVSVVDDGRGMRPDPAARGLGLGLSLIGSVASALRIERATPRGTRVTMRFG